MSCNYKYNKYKKFNQICNKEISNDCCECNKYQQLSQEKCEQANYIIERANKVAQQAKQAEKRADNYKQQALEECSKANCLWDEYKKLSKQGEELMKQAKDYMEESVKCYKECYSDDYGCNMNDYGYEKDKCEQNKHSCNCNHNCGCNNCCGC